MTDSPNGEADRGIGVTRRDVLKTVGAAGALGAFGSEAVVAKTRDRKIVGTHPGKAGIAKGKAKNLDKVIDLEEIGQLVIGHWPEEALQGLEKNPHIKYINDDGIPVLEQETPSWGFDRIDAEVVHGNGETGSGTDIGILDTGIDLDHPDLVGNLADVNDSSEHRADSNCTDSAHPDGNCIADWDDTNGHGTHVAGIAAAVANDQDVIGVAADATLHAMKAGPCSKICDAIRWAANNGFDVVNASLGGCSGASDAISDAVDYALGEGTIFVASAGNAGPCSDDCVSTPGTSDNTITVSSTNDNDGLRGDSSTGPEVNIAAPGNAIESTWNNGGTVTTGGTSMAAPHVTGAVASLRAAGVPPEDVQDRLENNAEDIDLRVEAQGAGLLDLAAAHGHDSANDLVEVRTWYEDDIQYTEATLHGELTELTGNDEAAVFFEYRKATATSWTHQTSPTTLTGTGQFEETITGLEEDTDYEYRAGVTVEEPSEGWESTEYGEVDSFDTEDNPDPFASFTHDPAVPDPGDTVTFDAAGSDPGEAFGVTEDDSIVSYEWDFQDDGTYDETGETATHTYASPDDVTVRLRVTDEFGQTDETTETFRVNALPEAAFTHTPTLPDEQEVVEFDATSSVDPDGTIDSYEWDFGDGNTATTTDPVIEHTYALGDYGEHDVTLTVTDNDDTTDEVIQTIRINAFPAADFDVVTDPPVRDEPVEFDASDSVDRDPGFGGAIQTYEWDFGDGNTATTTDPVIEHTYTTGGDKTVTLRVIDNDGASHDDLSVHEEGFTVSIRVAIDVKPGSDPNSINPRAPGEIPVAVLQTSAFDSPARLDHESVHFGDPDDVGFDESTDPFTPEGGATPAHSGGHVEDVTGDGDADSVFHFPTQDADFEGDDADGKLVGLTNDADPIPVFATDSVNIVGGGGGGP